MRSLQLFTLALLATVAIPARADSLTFSSTFAGGSVGYYGGATPLHGFGISPGLIGIDFQNKLVSPADTNFETGNLIGNDLTDWFFDGGGSITVTGGVSTLSGGPGLDWATLFTGSFLSASVQGYAGFCCSAGAGYDIVSGEILGTVNPDLLAILGLPDGQYFGTISVYFLTCCGFGSPNPVPPDSFTSGGVDEAYIELSPV